MTLNNKQIKTLANLMRIPSVSCIFDEDIDLSKKTGYAILNLGDTIRGGTHWVACAWRSKEFIYFDSFCQHWSKAVTKELKRQKYTKKGYVDCHAIQDLNSSLCGWFSLYFLWYIHNKGNDMYNSANDFTELFSEDTDGNSKKLQMLFIEQFGNLLPQQLKNILLFER